MPYALPADVDERPVVIDGAGTLGRRIAAVYAAGGSDVRIFDLSIEQREAARDYVEEHVAETQQTLGLHPARRGGVEVLGDLQEAVAGGWMVIEAVPERIELKTEVFGDLDRLAEPDAILCSNSSSIPTSRMIGKVEHPERVLNTHYQQPPELNAVELMSCGETDEGVIDALMEKIPHYGLVPFHVRRESDGFIFNRIWAAAAAGWKRAEEGYAAWLDVFQANTLVVRALERGLKEEFGLPLAGYEVLVRLAEAPEGKRLKMQELARRVLLSKSGLSQLFSRLERRGLVERRGDPENLRVTYATITAEGREALERALPAFREEIEERFAGHLDEEEIRTVRRAMRKVIRASGEEPLSKGTND